MPRHFHAYAHRPATGVLIMCGLVAGTLLQLQQAALWPAGFYVFMTVAAIVAASVAYFWLRRHHGVHAVVAVAAAITLGFALTGWRAAEFDAQRMPAQWEGKDMRVVGRISHMPQPSERSVRMRFDVERAWLSDSPQEEVVLPPHIALTWYGDPPPQGLQAGQRWQWIVRLKAPHGERNPHGMDWELWQWSQGIQATGYVRQGASNAQPQWLENTSASLMAQWRGHLHQAIHPPDGASARLQASMGVVQALVTGAQSSIHTSDWQLFRDTGIAHLVSISGLHITMFAWLATGVVNVLWRRSQRCCLWLPAPMAAACAGWCLAALYAVFSGWGIPAQRTIGMLAVVVWMRCSGRYWPWPYVWLAVLTAVVLLDPWSLLQAGFWLSFVAVGILFAAQMPQLARPAPTSIARRSVLLSVRRLLQEQWAIGLALAPLTLLLFGQISLVGMLANLWAIPWVTLVITPLSMLGALYPPLWTLAAHGVSAMVGLLEAMANWPLAVVYFAQPPWWVAGAGVVACLWLVMPWDVRWRLMGLPAVLPMLLWVPAVPAHGEVEMLALDVGQGSAVLLRTHAHSLLFDAGPRWSANADAGARTVVPLLRALGIRPTSMMISHADSDHAGGALSVQQAYRDMHWLGAGGTPCERGQSWQWDGVSFEVLHPPRNFGTSTKTSSNASSCVLRVQTAGGQRILLTGDIGLEQELALIRSEANMQAQVLLVPHHGSASSSSAALIAQVRPRFAVVQAGYLNRYGHPAPSVVQRYAQAGVQVVATPSCGAVHWHSVRPDLLECERAIARRYWAHIVP